MPVYVYRNLVTNETFEYQQRITEDALSVDPRTGDPVRRVIQPVGIAFKGSGFYVNDSRSAGSSSAGSEKSSTGAGSGSSDSAGAGSSAATGTAGSGSDTSGSASSGSSASGGEKSGSKSGGQSGSPSTAAGG